VPDNPTKDALNELLDYLEQVETQSGAMLAFLRDNDILTDENFAPYLEKASNATDVKSRAIRARFDFLFNTDDAKPATDVVPAPHQQAGQGTPPQPESKRDKEKSSSRTEDEPSGIIAGREADNGSFAKGLDEKRPEPNRSTQEPDRSKRNDAA